MACRRAAAAAGASAGDRAGAAGQFVLLQMQHGPQAAEHSPGPLQTVADACLGIHPPEVGQGLGGLPQQALLDSRARSGQTEVALRGEPLATPGEVEMGQREGIGQVLVALAFQEPEQEEPADPGAPSRPSGPGAAGPATGCAPCCGRCGCAAWRSGRRAACGRPQRGSGSGTADRGCPAGSSRRPPWRRPHPGRASPPAGPRRRPRCAPRPDAVRWRSPM